jgi:hypothetical protein
MSGVGKRVGVSACGRLERVINFVDHVDRQSYFQYADPQNRRCADTLPHAGLF